jgi:hypothetical protein
MITALHALGFDNKKIKDNGCYQSIELVGHIMF